MLRHEGGDDAGADGNNRAYDCERRGLWAYSFVKRKNLAAMRARILGALDAVR